MNKRIVNIRDSWDSIVLITMILKDGCDIDVDKLQKEIVRMQEESLDGIPYCDIIEWIKKSPYNDSIEMFIDVANDMADTIWL